MKYFARKRFRVLPLVLTLGLLFGPAPGAEASWLENCGRFFGLFSPKPASRVRPVNAPARKQRIFVTGARGPGEPSLRSAVEEANAMLGEMKIPPRIDIEVTGRPMQVEYYYDDFRIVIPEHFAENFYPEVEAMKRSFVQHEYGHAVFDENFADYSVEWQNWLVSSRDRGPLSSPDRARVNPELRRLTEPYQELFADLLTVAAQGDPRAISQPLHRFAQANDFRIEMRDFSGNVFSSRWTEPELVVGEFGPIYGKSPLEVKPNQRLRKVNDEHLAFAPVRSYLWERYLSRPELQTEKPRFMRVVFDTIAQEILARHTDPQLTSLPFSLASARLLRALNKALAGYQLK